MDKLSLDQQLLALDPAQKGNGVETILSAYVGVTDLVGQLGKPAESHYEELEKIYFGEINTKILKGEISDPVIIGRVREVRERFLVYAKGYLAAIVPERIRLNETLRREEALDEELTARKFVNTLPFG